MQLFPFHRKGKLRPSGVNLPKVKEGAVAQPRALNFIAGVTKLWSIMNLEVVQGVSVKKTCGFNSILWDSNCDTIKCIIGDKGRNKNAI